MAFFLVDLHMCLTTKGENNNLKRVSQQKGDCSHGLLDTGSKSENKMKLLFTRCTSIKRGDSGALCIVQEQQMKEAPSVSLLSLSHSLSLSSHTHTLLTSLTPTVILHPDYNPTSLLPYIPHSASVSLQTNDSLPPCPKKRDHPCQTNPIIT